MIWNQEQLSTALSISVTAKGEFGKLQFNSRDVEKGDLFIALKGNRDGHEFVADAIDNGASAVIVSRDIAGIDQNKVIKVEDTYKALELLAEYKRKQSKAKFIAVTGSVGKTSTKEAIKLMLTSYGKVFASRGNFNNHLGLQINLASLPDDTDYAVIEMGMNAQGEILQLTKQVKPDVAVVTSVSEGHLQFFDSTEGIADAKCEIFAGLDKEKGIAIINRDIKHYDYCIGNINKLSIKNIITFGLSEQSNVRFNSYELLADDIVRLQYKIADEEIEITMPLIPRHLAVNFAAAFSAVCALGLDIEKAAMAIREFKPRYGRGNVVSIMKDDKEIRLICDYYNSSPESLKASLLYFSQFEAKSKIAIIGDMGELGAKENILHKNMVSGIIDSGADRVLLVGKIVKNIHDNLPSDMDSHIYENVELLLAEIDKFIRGNELVLIKGSRSIKLEKVAKYFGVNNVL